MPEFPGLAKAESTREWDTAFPLIYKIREQDEAYWNRYRGTPKAFVTLAAGQAMWASRFGNLTAIRYQVPTNTFASVCRYAVAGNLLANLEPGGFGLRFEPVRQRALLAAAQSQDFGQLFLGFSFFILTAALLLVALLFQFGLEQRAAEVGTFLALGYTAPEVRRMLLVEATVLALLGGVLGAGLGLGYAKGMLWALTTIWRQAVGAAELQFHATPASVVLGIFAGTLVAVVTIWATLRRQTRRPARELLVGEFPAGRDNSTRRAAWVALLFGLGALALVAWALVAGEAQNAALFFCVGALLLLTGLAMASFALDILKRNSSAARLTLPSLGVRGCARRKWRSLATMGLLASGCFVIVAVGAFRLNADKDSANRTSGTGGFTLMGEASLPVAQDLDTISGRENLGLGNRDLEGVRVVSLRMKDGDDASCLNLNRAQRPRILGVRPERLSGRFTFVAAASGLDRRQGWELLRTGKREGFPDEIPAIGDANSIQWALGKRLGDTLDYTDERGRSFKVRLVGAVANSILQGTLLVDETEFVKRFPSESYRMFFVDAPAGSAGEVSAALSRALQDFGVEISPAARRLNQFNAVQNTYLGTFQVLGGLGLLLGSAGLGVVVRRNVWERRGELGLLTAVGFTRQRLEWMLLCEHAALLGIGLGLGMLAAAIAVLPAMLSPATRFPMGFLAATLAAVVINGAIWTWVATRQALQGNLLAALRNE
jgi:ABC-type antimicrobial peptide transport system permease subunit